MELRWLEREIWTEDDGELLEAPSIERVLQYRTMFGWEDVPVERERTERTPAETASALAELEKRVRSAIAEEHFRKHLGHRYE
jgi:hypothetical protein